jgi:hypothetical protein
MYMGMFRSTNYEVSDIMVFRKSLNVSKTLITALKHKKFSRHIHCDSLMRHGLAENQK